MNATEQSAETDSEQKFYTQEEARQLARMNAWLQMHVDCFKKEDALFNTGAPFYPVTGDLLSCVPTLPPVEIRNTVSSPSMAGYLVTADAYAIFLAKLIRPHSTVLDVGCGCGKHARSLITHPLISRYIGLDVYKPSIDWCNESLVPCSEGRYEFHHIDVFSDAYNLNGIVRGTEVSFPVAQSCVDLAFAISLFTHLLYDDARHYLDEIRRAMKPTGEILLTMIENEENAESFTGNEIRFLYKSDFFISMVASAGFRLKRHLGRFFEQDAYLFEPR
ncbi:MAG: methyltransferase domain-containing protein [Bdellovibrionota bacterium]